MPSLSAPSTNTDRTRAYADIRRERGSVLETLLLTYPLKTQLINVLVKRYNRIKMAEEPVSTTCSAFLLVLLTVSFHFLFHLQRRGAELIPPQRSPLECLVCCKFCAHSKETQPPRATPLCPMQTWGITESTSKLDKAEACQEGKCRQPMGSPTGEEDGWKSCRLHTGPNYS